MALKRGGDKRGGAGTKKKLLKRISFGAVGKIVLPSEGAKHIFRNLALRRKTEGRINKS